MNVKIKLSRDENLSFFGTEEITLDMEYYLRGVVTSEIGNSALEACKAQAVVSRTFAAGRSILTDQSSNCQAFRASRIDANYPNAYQAIEETEGEVLYYNNKLALAYCCSSNGGIVNAKSSWNTKNYPYLKGGYPDEYDHGTGNTHTVGLSQLAAIERAKAGQTYKEILEFYFPGTTIVKIGGSKMPTEQEQKIIDYCLSKVGYPYVYGAQGQKCTVDLRKSKGAQYPEYAAKMKAQCQRMSSNKSSCTGCKWLDKTTGDIPQAYDCEGLIVRALEVVGIKMKSGSNSQWSDTSWQIQRGPIAEMPKERLCVVYRDDNGKKAHTGIWLGDSVGIVVDARGHAYGVKNDTLEQYGRWTHYALPKIPEYNPEVITVLFKAYVTSTTRKLNVRAAASSSSTRITQLPPQAQVEVIDDSNNTWWKIRYGTVIGYCMSTYLTKIESTTPPTDVPSDPINPDPTPDVPATKNYYVKIKAANEEQAKQIVALFKSAEIVGE